MKYIAKMVVHSIVRGGPSIPIFVEAIYWYFVTNKSDLQ